MKSQYFILIKRHKIESLCWLVAGGSYAFWLLARSAWDSQRSFSDRREGLKNNYISFLLRINTLC